MLLNEGGLASRECHLNCHVCNSDIEAHVLIVMIHPVSGNWGVCVQIGIFRTSCAKCKGCSHATTSCNSGAKDVAGTG